MKAPGTEPSASQRDETEVDGALAEVDPPRRSASSRAAATMSLETGRQGLTPKKMHEDRGHERAATHAGETDDDADDADRQDSSRGRGALCFLPGCR